VEIYDAAIVHHQREAAQGKRRSEQDRGQTSEHFCQHHIGLAGDHRSSNRTTRFGRARDSMLSEDKDLGAEAERNSGVAL
jgi:hypothetical protein